MEYVHPCAPNALPQGPTAASGLRLRVVRLCERQVLSEVGVVQDRLPGPFSSGILASRLDIRCVSGNKDE